MNSTGGRDNRKKGNQKTKDDERHVTELSKLVQSKASKEVMFEQFNLQADVYFHQKIKAHQAVINYTSKMTAENYIGNVFLKPDWRLFSFHISRQQVICLMETNTSIEEVVDRLLGAQIEKIESLLCPPIRKSNNQTLPLLALADGNWQSVGKSQSQMLLEAFEHRLSRTPSQTIHFFTHSLSFYKNTELIAVHSLDSLQRERWTYYLSVSSVSAPSPSPEKSRVQFYALNGLVAPIHECNNIIPIMLNENNVLDYLGFFCFFLKADRGSFYIITEENDAAIPYVIWDKHFIHNNAPLDLLSKFKAPRIIHASSELFLCEATIYYGSSISIVEIEVLKTGKVTLKQSTEICDLLPFRLEIDL